MKIKITSKEFDSLPNFELRKTFSRNKSFLKLSEKYKKEAIDILNSKTRSVSSGLTGISFQRLPKKADGTSSYQAKVSVYDHNGGRVFKTFTAATESEVKKLGYNFQQGLEKVGKKYVLPIPLVEVYIETLSEWVKIYIESRNIKQSTSELYKFWYNKYLINTVDSLPKLADIKITDITVAHAEELKNAMRKLGLSKELINSVKNLFSSSFKYAMTLEKLDKNVFGLIEGIKGGDTEPPEYLQESELNELLNFCKDSDMELFINVLARTGLRKGECKGLKWENIDFDEHNIYVRQQVYQDRITTLKTPKSRRTIELPKTSQLFTMLRHEKDTQQLLLKDGFTEERLVFSTPDGKAWSDCHWWRRLSKIKQHLSFKKRKWGFHTLRHTWITLNVADGHEVGKISRMAGHNDVSLTLSIYSHAIKGEAREVTESFENKIFITGGTQ